MAARRAVARGSLSDIMSQGGDPEALGVGERPVPSVPASEGKEPLVKLTHYYYARQKLQVKRLPFLLREYNIDAEQSEILRALLEYALKDLKANGADALLCRALQHKRVSEEEEL